MRVKMEYMNSMAIAVRRAAEIPARIDDEIKIQESIMAGKKAMAKSVVYPKLRQG